MGVGGVPIICNFHVDLCVWLPTTRVTAVFSAVQGFCTASETEQVQEAACSVTIDFLFV